MKTIGTRQHGFTLVELLLYVTIVGSLLIAVSLFFGLTLEARIKGQSINEVDQQGTLMIEDITRAVRNAESVTEPAIGATSSTLRLVMPISSVSPTTYTLDGTVIDVREGSGPLIPMTNQKVQVSGLVFRNLSRPNTPGVVQVSFTMSRTNASGTAPYTYQKTFTSSASLRQP